MENAMKKLITLAAMVMAVAASGNVLAHGDKPKHGGDSLFHSPLARGGIA